MKEPTKAQKANQQTLEDKMEMNVNLIKETNKKVTKISELELKKVIDRVKENENNIE